MLPAPRSDSASLRHVLSSALSAVQGDPNRLGLPPVRSAAVILVDGLGMSSLSAHAGHARHLMAAIPTRGGVIESGFPSTTASALASLTTGVHAGEHGMVGYSVLDPDHDRVVNQLSGWTADMHPEQWQPIPTVFERARDVGIDARVIAHDRYEHTPFTRAVLRGADFVSARTIAQRVDALLESLRSPAPSVNYVYIPELDMAGHAHGTGSRPWLDRLDELDGELGRLAARTPGNSVVLLTADHGMLDLAAHQRVVIPAESPLWSGVRHVAGEPRCLQLHLDVPGAHDVAAAWSAAEAHRAWIVTRDEVIASGWFGDVSPAARARMGDVFVAARGRIAYYDERSATVSSLAMVGQHGSLSPEELRIPLARWGARG